MASTNHYQLLDRQVMNDINIYNAYHYLQTAGSGGAEECARAFVDYMLPDLIAVQSSALTHLSIDVINLDNTADYSLFGLTEDNVGLNTGSYLSPFVCWAFKLTRTERGHHHGAKRIAGITESNQVDGVAESAALTALNTLASTMASPTFYGGNYFSPLIFRAPNSIKPGYDNAVDYFPVGSAFYVKISTQSSRKG